MRKTETSDFGDYDAANAMTSPKNDPKAALLS